MAAIWLTIAGVFNAIPDWLKKLLGALLIAAMIFAAGNIRGKRVARAECEEKARQAQVAADKQDQVAGEQVQQQDGQVSTWLTQQKKADDAKIAELEKRIGKGCVYDKSNADPDEQPSRVLDGPRSRARNP